MKEFFSINKVVSILVIVFVITFIICFYFLYGKYDLFRFPFNAEVWGNASDWTMVLVTLITAIYLVKTFTAQKNANDLSNKIYIRGIMPYFTVSIVKEEDRFYLELKANNNTIRNINLTNIHDGYLYNIDFNFNQAIVAKESFISIPVKENLPNDIILMQPLNVGQIKYSDNEMNFYVQVVYYFHGQSWTISDPEPYTE